MAVAFFLIATAAVFAETPKLSVPEASERLAFGNLVLLDIRSPEEWAKSGVAKGAWPVSMHTPEFPQQLQAILSKYQPDQIALICATGGRSAYVTEVLEKNGITGIIDVSEGMSGNGQAAGWIARGFPVVSVDEASSNFNTIRNTWE